MGTPAFAVPALEALAREYQVIAVYSQPPRPAGRGYQVQKSPVHEKAESLSIPVFTPKTFKDADVQKEFAAHNADVAVVAAYGLILPQAALDTPKYGCINIHASLLPRWRGASPIQHAIWKGDAQSGITIMQMEAGLDTGPMLLKGTVAITPQITTPMLHDALSAMGGDLIKKVLKNIDNLAPEKQDDTASTYAPMLKKTDGQINWSQNATDIDCQIRALNPWPGTYTTAGGKRLKVLSATPATGTGEAGKVLDRTGLIACGSGALQLQKVQPDGGKAMDVSAAINGGYLKIGDMLS
jgi:methionyl-tRNA formyltransferase